MTTTCTAIVLCKSPIAGTVKTRMCPPLSPEQAARLAREALHDTLDAVEGSCATRRVMVVEGDASSIQRPGWEVKAQRTGTLDIRLADAFDDVCGSEDMCGSEGMCASESVPTILVAMDTPQATTEQLNAAFRALYFHDAVMGPTLDGGYWLIGLRGANRNVFLDVPMSTAQTGDAQYARLSSLGMSVFVADSLRDLDTVADVDAVAMEFPALGTSRWWVNR